MSHFNQCGHSQLSEWIFRHLETSGMVDLKKSSPWSTPSKTSSRPSTQEVTMTAKATDECTYLNQSELGANYSNCSIWMESLHLTKLLMPPKFSIAFWPACIRGHKHAVLLQTNWKSRKITLPAKASFQNWQRSAVTAKKRNLASSMTNTS